MDWSEIQPVSLPISYFEVSRENRFWLGLPLPLLESLKAIEILDANSIAWSPVVFSDNVEIISIPFIEVWNKPTILKQIFIKGHNLFGVEYGIVFIKGKTSVSKLVNIHCLLDSEAILKKGTWYSPIKYSALISSDGMGGITSYLWEGSIECFEEVFYLYHLGLFDTFDKEVRSIIEGYIRDSLRNLDNRIRGKHVKILY